MLPEDVRSAAEPDLPIGPTHDDDRFAEGEAVLVRAKEPAEDGTCREHGPDGGAKAGDPLLLDIVSSANGEVRCPIAGDTLEGSGVADQIEVLAIAEGALKGLGTLLYRAHERTVDPVRMAEVGRRAEEQRVDDREHRSVGTDAQAQREHHAEGETGRPAKAPDRVPQVLPDATPPPGSALNGDTSTVEAVQIHPRPLKVPETSVRFTHRRVA